MSDRETFEQYWGGCRQDRSPKFAALNAWLSARRWIPVSERLPEDGVEVVCIYDSVIGPFIGYRHNIDWIDSNGYLRAVKYWQPLPPPPEELPKATKVCPVCGQTMFFIEVLSQDYSYWFCNTCYRIEYVYPEYKTWTSDNTGDAPLEENSDE